MWHWLNGPTVTGLVFLAGAGIAWRGVWFACASRRWPTTPARIDYLGLSHGRRSGAYGLRARYSYTVDGVNYESTHWRFGVGPSGDMAAITLAASTEIKPVGPVVFYDPDKPGRSCLVAGLDDVILPMAIVFSLIAVIALIVGIY
jgi:hypothetical protein